MAFALERVHDTFLLALPYLFMSTSPTPLPSVSHVTLGSDAPILSLFLWLHLQTRIIEK